MVVNCRAGSAFLPRARVSPCVPPCPMCRPKRSGRRCAARAMNATDNACIKHGVHLGASGDALCVFAVARPGRADTRPKNWHDLCFCLIVNCCCVWPELRGRRRARRRPLKGTTPTWQKNMLNTTTHTVTHGADGDVISLIFYPDTGCLRFADALGFFHELRPPHSWIAISSASRGVCRGTHAMTEVLNTLLREFCATRPRWGNGPARVSAAPTGLPAMFPAPVHTRAHASDDAAARRLRLPLPIPFGAGHQV